jgi:quercetin dioxygenase-like cupin family protein
MDTAQVSEPEANTIPRDGAYPAPHCRGIGAAQGALFHPAGYPLWRVLGQLGEGAALEWDARHGDEAIFVESGVLESGVLESGVLESGVLESGVLESGVLNPDADTEVETVHQGTTLIIEAGVPWRVRTVGPEPTRIVHFGTIATTAPANGMLGPPVAEGHGVHTVRPEDAGTIAFTGDATSVYFSDSTCPTCRITFFLYDGSAFADGYTGASHFHSEDEIIHMLEGELRVGPLTVLPGAAIAVPAELRYGLRTPGPYRYLDYRADVSTAVVQPGSEPVLETVANLRSFGG